MMKIVDLHYAEDLACWFEFTERAIYGLMAAVAPFSSCFCTFRVQSTVTKLDVSSSDAQSGGTDHSTPFFTCLDSCFTTERLLRAYSV